MRKNLQFKAWILLVVFTAEIFVPTSVFALGSGPSQPEMASFTPAGTNEMVDPFSGDFSYNIPLMDVEGYPINIAYNSGVTMEQEASWVGLGWNLNVGTVNRSVRGLPDDFKGEEITTETSMKPMKIIKLGASSSTEILGKEALSITANYGISFVHNNYQGFGLVFDGGIGASASLEKVGSVGGNSTVSSSTLDGSSINSSLSASLNGQTTRYGTFSFGAALHSGFNTRTGRQVLDLSTTAGYNPFVRRIMKGNRRGEITGKGLEGLTLEGSFNTSLIPIGMDTYTPFSSIKMKSKTSAFSASIGLPISGIFGNLDLHGSETIQEIEQETVNTKAYGYFFSEEASESDIHDYNTERSISINKNTTNLSPVNYTYDVFTASGNGVSGMFRPFRNDIGTLHKPAYEMNSSKTRAGGGEVGIGTGIRVGATSSKFDVKVKDEPWGAGNEANYFSFDKITKGSLNEKIYFKAGGDKALNQSKLNEFGGLEAVAFDLNGNDVKRSLTSKTGVKLSSIPEFKSDERTPRAKLFTVLTAAEAQYGGLSTEIESYNGSFYKNDLTINNIDRVGNKRLGHHVSEITQVNPDGERFIYGVPAYNLQKEEVTFTTRHRSANSGEGIRKIDPNDATKDLKEISLENESAIDGYYSRVSTPAYAHSFLLSGKTSADYQDVTGNGITPDDIGSAHKFNYTKTSDTYKWRVPYEGSTFMKGYESDDLDQKGSILYGVKELWYIHSVESKNQVAEFYTSPREDALGAKDLKWGGKPQSIQLSDRSYKLDSIKLYNKLDRLQNKVNAVPIKSVFFTYDYSLCRGVLNQTNIDNGKLTLTKIQFSYGDSELGLGSPYEFNYSSTNPSYNPDNMDRWGNYKNKSLNPENVDNAYFPYTLQDQLSQTDDWASAWSLTKIKLPTGGAIDITYESDDYAYVQSKDAMQMFPVEGAGINTDVTFNEGLYKQDYLYIKKPVYVSAGTDPNVLKRMFLGEEEKMDQMYFNFLSLIRLGDPIYGSDFTPILNNLRHPSIFEYAAGYTVAEDIGVCTNDTNYLYIKIPKGDPGPITKSIWDVFRWNLLQVLKKHPNINDPGLESVLRGMVANAGDIISLIMGYEDKLEKDEVASVFKKGESFIRLNSPTNFKKGGGSRVRSIVLNDAWNSLSGEGENSTYGQQYEYTTLNEYDEVISSGVASYEPMVGNDENPFREPVYFTAQESEGFVPSISAYQERPFGESFLPTATVGYSKVTVKNIHFDKGKTSKGITEHEYYTAKDFPSLVKGTKIQLNNNPAKKDYFTFPFINNKRHSFLTASQGYSIVLNDMHGKPKAETVYLLENINGRPVKKKMGGNKINYFHKATIDGLVLDNNVRTLTTDGYVKNVDLGIEYDFAIETRRSYDESFSDTKQANLYVGFGLTGVSVVPNINRNALKDKKELRTITTTKVVQMYGLIESVETYTDQFSTKTYNRLFDATTGEVLLTESEDEHLKNEFQYSIPAYSIASQKRMGPAYENIGYENTFDKSSDTICNKDGKAYVNPGVLKHGDELLVYQDGVAPYKAWVKVPYEEEAKIDDGCTLFAEEGVRRLNTAWYGGYGAVCADNLYHDPDQYLKGENGEIMESIEVYHLKETFVDKINAISYSTDRPGAQNINLGHRSGPTDLYIATAAKTSLIKPVSGDVARFLLPYNNYDDEHLEFCTEFGALGGDVTIFGKGQNLSYNIKDITADKIPDLFDLTDTIFGSLEYIESNGREESEPYEFINYYQKDYNSCIWSNLRSGNFHYLKVNLNLKNDGLFMRRYNFGWPYSQINNRVILSNTDLIIAPFSVFNTTHYNPSSYSWTTVFNNQSLSQFAFAPEENGITNDGYYRPNDQERSLSSRSSIRFDVDQFSDTSYYKYVNETQLYLIKYKVELEGGGLKDMYYIEKGRALRAGEESPFWAGNSLDDCAYDKKPFNYSRSSHYETFEDRLKTCYDNYHVIDRAGNLITNLTTSDSYKIIRSGNDNRLIAKSGSLIAMNDPVKVDLTVDPGKFMGLKAAEDGLKIINATSLTYQEENTITQNYENNGNDFLQGTDGYFRVDSTLNYTSPRYQSSEIEISKDGYMEVLPPLWSKGACNDNYFPPQWNASSGWFLNNQVMEYTSTGIAVESNNNLNIPSSFITNTNDGINLVASNAVKKDVAFDGFENNLLMSIGGVEEKELFNLAEQLSSTTPTVLLHTEPSIAIAIKTISNNVIEGVAHSGKNSLFLKGENMDGLTNVQVIYKNNFRTPLSQVLLSEEIVSGYDTLPLAYQTTLNNHYTKFTTNLSSTLKQTISTLKSTGDHTNTLLISAGDRNGNFQPQIGKYLVSIWTKELVASGTAYQGVSPFVSVTVGTNTTTLFPAGPIIDGWQKIEGEVDYDDSQDLSIVLNGGLWGCFFDDFRMHPYSSNINTYVYNNLNNRLVAKLDENNYATFYEYDVEGIPSQLKRETDLGIITVSESRQSISKK